MRRITRSRSRAALALLLAASAFSVWRAPFYLPAAVVERPAEGPVAVFGYATLTSPVVRLLVVGRPTPSEPALLPGFRREGRDLAEDAEAAVAGRLFVVAPEGLSRLDRYERLGVVYERSLMTLADGRQAWVYRRIDPAAQRQTGPLR